jgi:hypothetical protein
LDRLQYIDLIDKLPLNDSSELAEFIKVINHLIGSCDEFLIDTTFDPKRRYSRYYEDDKNSWRKMFVIYVNISSVLIAVMEHSLIQKFKDHYKNRNKPRINRTEILNRKHNYLIILTK